MNRSKYIQGIIFFSTFATNRKLNKDISYKFSNKNRRFSTLSLLPIKNIQLTHL